MELEEMRNSLTDYRPAGSANQRRPKESEEDRSQLYQ